MIHLDIATVRFISAIEFFLLPTILLLFLRDQRSHTAWLWAMGGWLFGLGSLLLVFNKQLQFPGADLLVRLIFFTALVSRIQVIRTELQVPLSTRGLAFILLAWAILHETLHHLSGSTLLLQAYTSIMTALFSSYGGFLGFRLAYQERSRGAMLIGFALSTYGVLFTFRVIAVVSGTTPLDQLGASNVADAIGVALIILPVVDHMGFFAICNERLRRAERQAAHTVESQSAMEILNRQITHLDRQKTLAFMSTAIAHELSQPLTAIRSNAQLAEQMAMANSANDPRLATLAQNIGTNAARAADLLDKIRRYIRPSDAKSEVFDLRLAVADAISLMRPQLDGPPVNFRCELAPAALMVRGSQIEIAQILVNFLKNALDAVATVSAPMITLSLHGEGDNEVVAEVIDNGPGLAAGDGYQPFVTSKPRGLGLGLSISQTIAAQHGGRIELRNAATRGAAARLYLPVHCS